jgi:hypothetical protein
MPRKGKPTDGAAEEADYKTWRARALLERQSLLPGVMRERDWRRLYMRGVTPEDAAGRAQVAYYNTRPAFPAQPGEAQPGSSRTQRVCGLLIHHFGAGCKLLARGAPSWEARGLGNLAAKMLQFFGQLLQYHCSLSFCRPSITKLAVTPDALLLEKPVHQRSSPCRNAFRWQWPFYFQLTALLFQDDFVREHQRCSTSFVQGRFIKRPRRGPGACHESADRSRRLSGGCRPVPGGLDRAAPGRAGDREEQMPQLGLRRSRRTYGHTSQNPWVWFQ